MSSAPAASKAKAKPKTNMLEDFALGGLSAAISKTVAAPIERVKLLLQNQGEAAAITKPYTGIVDVFIRVPKEQGIASFWRGNMANVIRYFPTQALNFMFKDFYKQYLEQPRSAGFIPCLLGNMASGGAAGATSLVVVYPLDFARTRLAMDVGKGDAREFTGTVDCILKTAKQSGWGKGGVYNGFTISCVGIIFYRGAYFGLYDTINDQDFMRKGGFGTKFAVGYAVTVTAGLLSYPLDFARTRLAMDVGKGDAREFTGTVDCILKTAKQSGWGKGGVYNGFTISCVGIVFYRGAYFGLYDTINDQDFMRKGGFATKFAVGYAVTVTAGLLSYPLDTIRRRLMMTSGKHAGKYKSSMDAFSQIMKNEGAKALYKGAGSNILRGLAGALVLVGFDYCKNFYLEWKYPELKGQKKEIKIQFG